MQKIIFLILLMTFCNCPAAIAKTVALPLDLAIQCPDDWNVETDAGSVEIRSANEVVTIVFNVAGWNFPTAKRKLEYELSKIFKELTVTAPVRDTQIHGLDAAFAEGTGVVKGLHASWILTFVSYNGRVLEGLGYTKESKFSEYSEDILDIFNSIQPQGGWF